MILEKEDIKKYLPHREPFLFVDTVEEFLENKRIIARLNLNKQMDFFRGHFPERPIMPGVLMVEALAQTSGLIISLSKKSDGGIFYLASSNIKFLEVVEPDVCLEMRSSLDRSFNGLYQFSVEALVSGKTAVKGSLVLADAR